MTAVSGDPIPIDSEASRREPRASTACCAYGL